MSFDSSRLTSDPWQNFFGVVMQQGRVQLDSDWNEWIAEFTRRIQAGTLDVVGQAGVPSSTPNGFLISLTGSAPNYSVSIGQGRIYVDGILAENHGTPVPNPEKWTPAADALPLSPYPGWDIALAELVGTGPVDYNQQPYYPNPNPFPQSGGPYLIYVDVWQREITFLEDPDLIEKAVGVDTTGRIQTVWQVKWLDVSGVAGVTCSTDIPSYDTFLLPPGPRLTTGVVTSAPSGPCCLTSNTGYTGIENQLYRLEIHQPGSSIATGATLPVSWASGIATFKWSKNNASVATGVTAIAQGGTVLTVNNTGKDSVLRFSNNDWVEITDDWLELNGLPGEIHQVSLVTDSNSTITLATAVSATNFPVNASNQTVPQRNTRLVKWDQKGQVFESDGVTVWTDLTLPGSTGDIPVPSPGTTLILEDGITVTFNLVSPGTGFLAGHAWNFAARTADGTVEYLDNAPPRTIYHHYARLSLVTVPGTPTDCRNVFPPLTGISEDCCCSCSVTVGDGISSTGDYTDIQKAINSLSTVTGPVEVCLLAGTFSPPSTITITQSKMKISGCSLANIKFSGPGPLFDVTSASEITFDSLNIQTATSAIQATQVSQLTILGCEITVSGSGSGPFAIVSQSSGLVATENQLTGGGIWVLDGSSQIEIKDNVITNAQGPGIGLGGLPSGITPAPAASGVIYSMIDGNQITGASNSGISTVFGNVSSGSNNPALGDVEDLTIVNNVISNCAQAAPMLPYFDQAVAGILLEASVNVCIRGNVISNNGTVNGIPTCGIYAAVVYDLDIDSNEIIDNGVAANPKGSGVQAGIYGLLTLDSLRINNNEIKMLSGSTLNIVGAGPMSITGNNLQSYGVWGSAQASGFAATVFNFGLPLELSNISMGPLDRAFAQATPGGQTPFTKLALVDGRTMIDGNQLTFIPNPVPAGLTVPYIFISLDDLSLQNNQFETTIVEEGTTFMLADTVAMGLFSLRVTGNRFSEFPVTALLSHLGIGLYNIVNLNQATHCVLAMGTNTMAGTTNQVIIQALCSEAMNYLKALIGGI